jgi:hypothetical protein
VGTDADRLVSMPFLHISWNCHHSLTLSGHAPSSAVRIAGLSAVSPGIVITQTESGRDALHEIPSTSTVRLGHLSIPLPLQLAMIGFQIDSSSLCRFPCDVLLGLLPTKFFIGFS